MTVSLRRQRGAPPLPHPNISQAVPGPGDFDSRRPFFPQFGLEEGIYYTCRQQELPRPRGQAGKHVSHGLDFIPNYTYSKAMGYSNFGGGGFDDNYHPSASYGPAGFNPTHALSLANVWQIPYGHGRRWGAPTAARQRT